MIRRGMLVFFVVLMVNPAPAAHAASWYRCIVRAASHTGYYTFRISTNPCRIYWREINSWLEIQTCKKPVISGLKPSATDIYSIVWFNLEDGRFYDYLSGVKDRGYCKVVKSGRKP